LIFNKKGVIYYSRKPAMSLNKFSQQTACFTGHRPDSLGGYDESNDLNIYIKNQLKLYIEELIISKGIKFFISGGALGVDIWAAEIVLELKQKHKIKLFIAQPFPSQSSKWSQSQKQKYNNVLSRADKVITVSPDPYSAEKMRKRNFFMVDNSDYVIAVFNGDYKTGTGHCINYARKNKKNIYFINF
jgi:uncharacterized phage-like protein YoqJ